MAAQIDREHRPDVVIWLQLARIYHRLEQSHREVLADFDLTPAQFDVLSHLANQPGQRQQELADSLLVTKGNVCGLLDRLEEAELVERQPDPSDRRANSLHLTPQGWQRFREAAPAIEGELSRTMGALNPIERRQLRKMLGKLERTLRP